jgi:cytochrome c oxidase assembly factor CtaG
MIEAIAILLGIAYGYMTPGRQNKMELFKMAIVYGVVIGIVLGLIGWFTGINALGAAGATLGLLVIVVSALIVAVLFVIGAWIGDFIEEKAPRKA